MKDLWSISTTEHTDGKETIMRTGNVYQIANGYMGYRGTLDEFGPDELVGITLAGIYDQVGSAWREPVNAPNGGFTRVTLDGREISARSTRIKRHRQTLNLENAMFERETEFVSHGKTLTIRSSRFLSVENPHLGVIKFSVVCDQSAWVTISTGIDYNIWDLNGPHLLRLTPKKQNDILVVRGVTHELGKRVTAAEAVELDFGKETYQTKGRKNLRLVSLKVEA